MQSMFVLLRALRRAQRLCCQADRSALPPAAQWLRDNARALYGQAVSLKAPARALKKEKRLYALCRALGALLNGDVSEKTLIHALNAQQLTVQELRLLPDMLRYTCLEALCALLPALLAQLQPSPRQTREALENLGAQTGAAVSALLALPKLDFSQVTAACSAAYQALLADATFQAMDEEGRALYLSAVYRLSRRARCPETRVCAAAFACCQAGEEVGFYLLHAPERIARELGLRARPALQAQKLFFTLHILSAVAALCLSLLLLPAWGAPALAVVLYALLCRLLTRALSRLLPPRLLPRLRADALPEGTRALVTVPVVLSSAREALKMCRQLFVLFLANEKAPVDFLLLGDFALSDSEKTPQDEAILSAEAQGMDALCQSAPGRFFYLHRKRFADADGMYCGRERKRGALLLLCRLLTGESAQGEVLCTSMTDFTRYTHIITLDADTLLPCGEAEKLLGAITHPLQRGRVNILQPRMLSLPMHTQTRAQQFLGGVQGASGYGAAGKDVYQDVFGRGSFMGKGIFVPAALLNATRDLPSQRILSHDLLEGELTRAALAEDIVCYDGHPRTVAGFMKRLHRWTRGDWQLLPFLRSERLDALSRFKLWENLFRSLLPAFRVLSLLISAYCGAYLPFILSLLPPVPLALLPLEAATLLDAILRALYRQFISKRQLLEWTTAAQAEKSDLKTLKNALPPLFFGALMLFVAALWPFLPGFLLGLLWLCLPLVSLWLDQPLQKSRPLSPPQRQFLQAAAQDTAAFFAAHVNARTHFLPPDNVQLSPPQPIDLRISPTNAGLYLLSLLAMQKMGIINRKECLSRLSQAVNTLEQLPLWHGIPYNWYDLTTLQALPPRFVSSVDAGNYALCLMAAAQGVRALLLPGDDEALPARLDQLCDKMAFNRLYDHKKRLFFIGYEGDGARMSEGHYDLFASEALLLSFAAIVKGDVSEKHWWRLGRPMTHLDAPALLSWSGTAFEYLMSALLLPAYPGSLLSVARAGCVRAQKKAGMGEIFGISESACAQLDPQLHYRYQAFGVAQLSLRAGDTQRVYAPYAAALSLCSEPQSALRALQAMKKRAWYGEYGFFEAADCTSGEEKIVKTYMAHHQGMVLCALCNALCDNFLQGLLLSLPRVQAHLPLLCELAPRYVPSLPLPLQAHRDAPSDDPCRYVPQAGDALLLFGAGTSLLLTANGSAHLFRGEQSLTRFTGAYSALSGPQLYWQCGAERLRLTGGEYVFSDGLARCALRTQAMSSDVSLCVDPVTGAGVWRARVRNLSASAQTAALVFACEPCLQSARDDQAHIAFSNLFLSVEKTADNACLVRRRLREEAKERTLSLRAFLEEAPLPLRVTGDLDAFLGRLGDLDAPKGIWEGWTAASAPEACLAAQGELTLLPGQEATVCFTLGKEEITAAQAQSAFELSRLRVLSSRRMLHLDARQTALAHRLAGALLCPRAGQAAGQLRALWQLGVSGDVPYLLLNVPDESALNRAVGLLRLLAYLCEQGAQAEALLLIPKEEGYEQPLRTGCEGLTRQSELRALHGRLRAMHVPDPAPLHAFCALYIDCGKEIEDQFPKPVESPYLFPGAAAEGLTTPRLQGWNGFGGFLPEGGYRVLHTPPAPWCHMVCSEHFGTLLCDSGILYSYVDNSRLQRLTRVSQSTLTPLPSEEYFLRENARAWSLTPLPLQNAPCALTMEAGVATYHSKLPDLDVELSVFASQEQCAGARCVTVRNTSKQARTVTFFAACRFALGESGRGTACEARENAVFARGDLPCAAYFTLSGATAHTMEAGDYGLYGMLRHPGAHGAGTVGLLEREITLRPGESQELSVWLGYANALPLLPRAKLCERQTRAYWQSRLGRLQFFLPDALLSQFLNLFLPYQVRAARLMARAGFYQAGGAWGFRDQLQDMLSLLYTEPERVREHLLFCASRQYLEGDVQHWWHAGGAGVRTRISDDLLFLPYVTAQYVSITGDESILGCRAPYLRSPALAPAERDRYEACPATRETESLLEHCLRALRHVQLGPHGIPLMRGGDWNDGMNRVGGESAWLGFFYVMALRDFAPLCEKSVRRALDDTRIRLQSALQSAWTGQWFLRAWYEDGRTLGAPDSEIRRIDLISQCFACFAGMPRDQVLQALDNAWAQLHRDKEGITLLLTPPFTPEENAGYIGAYAPGVRENGGQYTHAVPWLMRALLMTGQTQRAWQLLYEILPYNHSQTPAQARHYRVEPYVLAADVYENGRGGWTWYTGSAGWLYTVFVRDFLGLDKRGDYLRLCPRLPQDWEECTVLYHYGQSRYQLCAQRDTPYATLDGEKAADGWIRLTDDGNVHEARFPLTN